MNTIFNRKHEVVQDPPLAQLLFNNPKAGWLWLVLRVWLGWEWLSASLHKIGTPGWTGTGEALKGFWTSAVAVPEVGKPAITFDWYRSFLQMLLDAHAWTWFGPMIAYSEFLVGLALIVGAFTGIAAFGGALMNWNFMMAGSASTNPLLLVIAIGLILSWKVAGYIGLDYFLLPLIGTPWRSVPVTPMPEPQLATTTR
jgi:thiosulfate dehydrogenase [quinone] large subunit